MRQARTLLRAAVDLLGTCDLQQVAEAAVTTATSSFADAARLDVVMNDGRLYPMAASDTSGELLVLAPSFHGDHPLIQRLIASGDTGLRVAEDDRCSLWGQGARETEIVMSALIAGRRTRGILTFLNPRFTEDAASGSDHRCRSAFAAIVSRALDRALECDTKRRDGSTTWPEGQLGGSVAAAE